MHKDKLLEVLDGVMLGDGDLRMNGRNAHFQMTKSGEEYLGYLRHVGEVLRGIGAEVCSGYPKSYQEVDKRSNPYTLCSLSTLTSPFLTTQFRRWYRYDAHNGKWTKVVPEDLGLTPISLAYWFMDDGTTSWFGKIGNRVALNMCSDSFSKPENIRLQELLETKGIHMGVCSNSYGGWKLATTNISAVGKFLTLVGPYIMSCYEYKVKKPWYVDPSKSHPRLHKKADGGINES